MKKRSRVVAIILGLALVAALTACGSKGGGQDNGSAEKDAQSVAGQKFTVGICQLVQHDALDAATNGFMDAITEELGDSVVFDKQNASGDSAT